MENISNKDSWDQKVLKFLGIILRLLGFVIVGGILATFVVFLFPGLTLENLESILLNPAREHWFFILTLQGVSQVLMFIVLPFLYLKFFKKDLFHQFHTENKKLGLMALFAFLILFSSLPLISYIQDWNKTINFPDAMGLDEWIHKKEAEAKRLTEVLAYFNTVPEFLFALLVIAILPAIGEEFLFRGIIQNELREIFKNPHTAIWIAGFIFSFFHFQFLGFFPRMILGVTFGYLYYWSGSLTIPMLVHFLNNAMALILYNMYQQRVIKSDPESSEFFPPLIIAVSCIVFIFLLFTFKNLRSKKDNQY